MTISNDASHHEPIVEDRLIEAASQGLERMAGVLAKAGLEPTDTRDLPFTQAWEALMSYGPVLEEKFGAQSDQLFLF